MSIVHRTGRLVTLLLTLSAGLIPAGRAMAAPANLAGTWSMLLNDGGGNIPASMHLAKHGTRATGTLTAQNQTYNGGGRQKGSAVHFSFSHGQNVVTLAGAIDATSTSMTGTGSYCMPKCVAITWRVVRVAASQEPPTAGDPLTGTWRIVLTTPGSGHARSTLVIHQQGQNLAATLQITGEPPAGTGTIHGRHVRLVFGSVRHGLILTGPVSSGNAAMHGIAIFCGRHCVPGSWSAMKLDGAAARG